MAGRRELVGKDEDVTTMIRYDSLWSFIVLVLIYMDSEVLGDREKCIKKSSLHCMLKCEMQVSLLAASEMIVPRALAGSQSGVY